MRFRESEPGSLAAWVLLALLLAACGAADEPGAAVYSDLQLGRNAVALQRYDLARIYFEKYQAQYPDKPEAYRLAGDAWISGYQQSYARAVQAFRSYLSMQPDNGEVRQTLIKVLLLMDQAPSQAELAGLGETLADQQLRVQLLTRTQPKAALVVARAALRQYPDDPGILSLLAELELAEGNPGEALALADRAVSLDPLLAEVHYLRTRVLRGQRDIEGLKEALDDHAAVRAIRAEKPQPAEVLTALERLEQRFGAKNPALILQRAKLGLALKEAGMAVVALDQLAAVECSPSDLLSLAVDAEAIGLRSESERLFERVLQIRPGNSAALGSLGLLALSSGKLAEAGKLLEQGIRVDPDSARLRFLASRLAMTRGELQEAREQILKAIALAPWEWRWRLQGADLLQAEGQLRAARQLLAEAPESNKQLQDYRRRVLDH